MYYTNPIDDYSRAALIGRVTFQDFVINNLKDTVKELKDEIQKITAYRDDVVISSRKFGVNPLNRDGA